MGLTAFHVPQPERLPAEVVRQCYMQGIDGVPWPSQNTFADGVLTIRRVTGESGTLYVPWPVPGRGRLTLSTTCLREDASPFHLPVELARGTVGRLRNQVGNWKLAGLDVPDDIVRRTQAASQLLGRAATGQHRIEASTRAAEQAIAEALDAIDLLMQFFSQQALDRSGKRSVFLAANLGNRAGTQFPEQLLGTINTAVVPFSWSEVEGGGEAGMEPFAQQVFWSKRLGLRVCGGPLLDFHRHGFPDWLYLWEEDPESLQSYMIRYVESVVAAHASQVNLWHAWSGLNSGTAMPLSEEQRLRLGVATLESLRKLAPHTPVFVSFSQPFGEYLSRQTLDLAPIHYADTLVRADLGVSGLGVELDLGYWPGGTLPRDLLEISRLIDRWSSLGLPLVIILRFASSLENADEMVEIQPCGVDQAGDKTQAKLADDIIRLCISKPAVQGVVWGQLYDGDSKVHGSAGVFDTEGHPKPVLQTLREIRSRYLS